MCSSMHIWHMETVLTAPLTTLGVGVSSSLHVPGTVKKDPMSVRRYACT